MSRVFLLTKIFTLQNNIVYIKFRNETFVSKDSLMKRNSQPRNTKQRRHTIMQFLQEQGEVSVDQLVQLFDISEVTIRKDLSALETSGFYCVNMVAQF